MFSLFINKSISRLPANHRIEEIHKRLTINYGDIQSTLTNNMINQGRIPLGDRAIAEFEIGKDWFFENGFHFANINQFVTMKTVTMRTVNQTLFE